VLGDIFFFRICIESCRGNIHRIISHLAMHAMIIHYERAKSADKEVQELERGASLSQIIFPPGPPPPEFAVAISSPQKVNN
jgi:hypothetical protein